MEDILGGGRSKKKIRRKVRKGKKKPKVVIEYEKEGDDVKEA